MSTVLQVENINVYYGSIHAVKDVSFHVEQGEVVTLIGANGAGKSTTLNTVAGLLHSRTGSVRFMGEELRHVPSHKLVGRGMALVPEGRRIFQHMTVQENLDLGGYCRGGDKSADMECVFERFPQLKERRRQVAGTLSGGEQQMLAIGRALMSRPEIIMMDEPFAALDYFTREQMQKELLRVQQERSASILFVTHSIDEALILGSQIAVIEKGMVKALYEVKAPQEERNLLEDEMITLKRDIINNLHFI